MCFLKHGHSCGTTRSMVPGITAMRIFFVAQRLDGLPNIQPARLLAVKYQ